MAGEVVSWPALIGATLGALLTGAFAWLTQANKSQVDQSANAFQAYEKITKALQDQVESLSKRVTALEDQLAEAKVSHADEIASLKLKHADELRIEREEKEGLRRQIAQNSQSTAQMLGADVPPTMARKLRKLDGKPGND